MKSLTAAVGEAPGAVLLADGFFGGRVVIATTLFGVLPAGVRYLDVGSKLSLSLVRNV